MIKFVKTPLKSLENGKALLKKKNCLISERWYKSDFGVIKHKVFSTVNKQGRVSSRTVVCRNTNDVGFLFLGFSNSPKGNSIQDHPQVAIVFAWHYQSKPLIVQVRIEGLAEFTTPQETEELYRQLPLEV